MSIGWPTTDDTGLVETLTQAWVSIYFIAIKHIENFSVTIVYIINESYLHKQRKDFSYFLTFMMNF